jgi:acetyl-CoA acetyltransferase
MDSAHLRNRVAIVGAGFTNAKRNTGLPVASLAIDASLAAIDDAGVSISQLDGVACGAGLPAYGVDRGDRDGMDLVTSRFLATHLPLDAEWSFDHASFPPALIAAVHAVASGAATYALVNRTVHQPTGRYHAFDEPLASGTHQWTAPYGCIAPVNAIAMTYMEYQQRFGARREHMATLALQLRENAQAVPETYWNGQSLTFEDYMTCRMISEPMCLYDNDIPVDASVSVIITSAERAADLRHPAVYVTAWAETKGSRPVPPGTFGPLDYHYEAGFDIQRRLWQRSGWRPEDIDVPQLYDGFTPLVYLWLETMGFCGVGEAWEFIQDGRIAAGGAFPLLSGGGSQGWGRIHGVQQILECYLQLSRRAEGRQILGAETGLSTFATPINEGVAILFSAREDT